VRLAVAGGAVLVLGLAVVAAVQIRGRPGGAPVAAVQGSSWTHKELAEHLRSRGVRVTVVPALDLGGRPAAWFYDGPEGDHTPRVLVILAADTRDAREQAGALGADSWSWGRFAFQADGPELAARYRRALE
jgi:hypothetical protein